MLLRLGRARLDAADQFILDAFRELHVILGQLREFLLQLAFGDVPNSFGTQCIHIFL